MDAEKELLISESRAAARLPTSITGLEARASLGLDPWPPPRALNVLQHARVARGLSQEELAAELGISRQTVSSLENRRRIPSVRLALAIASALNATVEDLFPTDEVR